MAVIFAKGRENRINNAFIETTNSNFQLECIKWHNYFRKLHGVQPLQYSPAVSVYLFFNTYLFILNIDRN